ncbi:MAG: hypothetical protein ABFC54_03660 [Thermoguttaceae bacterium]
MSIYKPCDIRGDAATELTSDLYERWGRILGRRAPQGSKFLVGGDVRASTPEFLAALVCGLSGEGLDVVQLGQLPTPMIYYAKRRIQAAGCAIVTASHNPASMNGLKWMVGDRPPSPDEVAAMARPPELSDARPLSVVRSLDISFDYVACLQEAFVESMDARLHVVLDPMHGAWSERARRYLHAIFPQCLFSTIHDRTDAQFGGRTPDCTEPRHLTDLCDAVYQERAHLGVAFDGDGDRIALVDGDGVALRPEETAWTLLSSMADELPGQPFVYDVKLSDRIVEAARRFGAEPLPERSGHSFLRERMLDTDALFGAEVSGHYFYRRLGGGDDGFYTVCRLLAYLARSGRSLAELRKACPPMYITPNLRIAADAARQSQVLEQVRTAWADFPQRTVDGLRIDFPGGWALVRRSVTEPSLTFRFEGLDWHALEDLVERFCDALPDEGDELWARYRATMGGESAS